MADGEQPPDLGLRGLLDEVLRAAMAHTGMSREELLAEAERLPPPELRPDRSNPIRRTMQRARVPEEHIRSCGDRPPKPCDALRVVEEFLADEQRRWLVLSGGKGVRKTGSAVVMLGRIDHGAFVRAVDLKRIAFDDKNRFAEIERARAVVLDDLGWEGRERDEKGYWDTAFNGLADSWYGSRAKVIVTCNLTREQLRADYDERVIDRLRQSRPCFAEINGESYRDGERDAQAKGSLMD